MAWLYTGILALRNFAFNKGALPSKSYSLPVIAIGNLSTGGTGKTPFTEWLLRSFPRKSKVVISRGYGRKTKGYLRVKPDGDARQYGDEPLQIAQKFKATAVWVSEKRSIGLDKALHTQPSLNLAVLDDAFQHRYVKAGFYVLLSTFQQPFYKDFVLPQGNLRESRKGAKRARAIVISKCPPTISLKERQQIKTNVARYSQAPVYFSYLHYGSIKNEAGKLLKAKNVRVITGIASPAPLLNYLSKTISLTITKHYSYKDHHNFTNAEVALFEKELSQNNQAFVTTEKDAVRLREKLSAKAKKNLYTLPIQLAFLGEDQTELLVQLKAFIKGTSSF
jgi:tetraacyldisaccharide 4'-kinase